MPVQVTELLILCSLQVRDLFRDRINLEREYATKLQVLAKKAADKKSKKIGALIVGLDPVKTPDEDSTIKQRHV